MFPVNVLERYVEMRGKSSSFRLHGYLEINTKHAKSKNFLLINGKTWELDETARAREKGCNAIMPNISE